LPAQQSSIHEGKALPSCQGVEQRNFASILRSARGMPAIHRENHAAIRPGPPPPGPLSSSLRYALEGWPARNPSEDRTRPTTMLSPPPMPPIVSSGHRATVDSRLLDVPMVVLFYRVSAVTANPAKPLVRTPFYSHGEYNRRQAAMLAELIQNDCTPDRVSAEVLVF